MIGIHNLHYEALPRKDKEMEKRTVLYDAVLQAFREVYKHEVSFDKCVIDSETKTVAFCSEEAWEERNVTIEEMAKKEGKAKAIDSLVSVALQCKDDDHEMIEKCLEEMGWEVWCRDGDVMFISRG